MSEEGKKAALAIYLLYELRLDALEDVLKKAVDALEDYIETIERTQGASLNFGRSVVIEAKQLLAKAGPR